MFHLRTSLSHVCVVWGGGGACVFLAHVLFCVIPFSLDVFLCVIWLSLPQRVQAELMWAQADNKASRAELSAAKASLELEKEQVSLTMLTLGSVLFFVIIVVFLLLDSD